LDLADRHAVPVSHARELVEGVRSDLSLVRIASEDELIRYAYRVASTVGLMMCRVLGVEREGDPFAIDLGIAMQLTNISRDVREDALNNRVYLPAAWVPAERVLEIARAGSSDPSVEEAVERALMLADRYYDSASLGMGYLRGAIRPGIRAAATNYRAIGSVIRRDPARALRGRVATSRRGKLLRSAVAVGTAVHEHFFRLRGPKHDSELHLPLATLSASTIPAT
ncbi:MAG: squalene/phytoene synthase family protein, partial [Planctomycetota bacterium]